MPVFAVALVACVVLFSWLLGREEERYKFLGTGRLSDDCVPSRLVSGCDPVLTVVAVLLSVVPIRLMTGGGSSLWSIPLVMVGRVGWLASLAGVSVRFSVRSISSFARTYRFWRFS